MTLSAQKFIVLIILFYPCMMVYLSLEFSNNLLLFTIVQAQIITK